MVFTFTIIVTVILAVVMIMVIAVVWSTVFSLVVVLTTIIIFLFFTKALTVVKLTVLVLALSGEKLIFIIIKISIKPNTLSFILFLKTVVMGTEVFVTITRGIAITVLVNIINKRLALVNNTYIAKKVVRYVTI